MNVHSDFLKRGEEMGATPTKQSAIFSASLVLFAERGFDATTIPMIAEGANVGAGTIYRYFKNKESLVNELFQKYVKEFLVCIEKGLLVHRKDFREGFHHIFRGMIQFTVENPRALRFIKTHSQGAFLDEKSLKEYEKLVDLVCDFFREGQQEGSIRTLHVNALIAILFGSFMEVHSLVESQHIILSKELLDELEESLWAAIKQC